MKTARIICIAALPVLYLLGRLTGRREYFLLLAVLTVVLLCALAFNLWTVLSFSYVQELDEPASVKGRERRLRVGIYNDKPFPFTMMAILVEPVPSQRQYRLSFNLPSKNSAHFEIPIHCPYRGIYHVGMTKIELNDVFGLTRLSMDMRRLSYYRQRELKVYPRVPELPYLPSLQRDAKGEGGRQRTGEGDSYTGTRDYRPGDPAKRIHWKRAGAGRVLPVREYETPNQSGPLIAIDTGKWNLQEEQALLCADLACECAAAVALYSLRASRPVRLVDGDVRHKALAAAEPRDIRQVAEWLAVLPFDQDGQDFPARLLLEAGGDVRCAYIMTHRVTPMLHKTLLGLRSRGVEANCLLLAPELSGEAAGPVGIPCTVIPANGDVAGILGDMP